MRVNCVYEFDFSIFVVISYGKKEAVEASSKKMLVSHQVNEKEEKIYLVYSLVKVSFQGQKNPQKYKNPNNIIPCKI